MRLHHTSEELKEQMELRLGTLQRAQHAEHQVQDLKRHLQSLETELLRADMHRDGLRHSKKQCEEFLEQLTVMMKVDRIDPDLGFEMKLKLVQSRAEQLVRQEAAALSESKRQRYGLQQKVKSQKDQLERKELHIQLLKKKVSDPEEEKSNCAGF
ncbi:hypothetical protein CHARACLAT_001976 [Characodon lateralis]|uniref:Uncharacterized protein n=1 Tax=Characodon lateralis TaxID=208331 RepID=A0ABU7E7Q4_9TELE|nr:hypothetical protein [Characodon lateralis]